jgi:hypothetical protein
VGEAVEDGRVYREQSADMAKQIRADHLFDGPQQTEPAA